MNKLLSTIKITTLLVSGILLSACNSMSSPPHCPGSSGFACARVDEIDRSIDQGYLKKVNSLPSERKTIHNNLDQTSQNEKYY